MYDQWKARNPDDTLAMCPSCGKVVTKRGLSIHQSKCAKHKARQESSPGPFAQPASPTVPSGNPGAPPQTSVPKPTAHPPRPTPTSAPLLGDPADNVNPANQLFTVSSMEGEVEGEAEGEHVEPPPGAL